MGGTGVDFGHAIAVDNLGNVYATGLFANTADFDPGAGVFNLVSAGSWDIYITKLDSSGIFQWAKRIGSTGDDRGLSIATDGASVYLTGMFSTTVDFDPGPGIFNLTSAGTVDVFVLKVDASGNFVWATRMGGSSDDHGNSLALDAASNVYVTGYFTGNVNGIANLNSAGQTDIFVMKLTTTGTSAWAKKMGSTGLDEGNGITVSSAGNVYSTGTFQVTVDFNPGGGNFNLSCTGGPYWDAYIQKLDANGNFVWAKQIGSVFEDRGFALTTDAAENVFTTGFFSDVADFDPGPGVFNVTANSGGKDIFIQKLDAGGNFLWAKNVGSWLMDQGYSIDVDGLGNVYTTGFFQDVGDFDPGPGVFNLTATGGQDIFLLKLNSFGNFMWALKFGANINDNGYATLTASAGIIYAAGFFGQTVDFDPGPGIFNLTSAGATDIFVIKLNDIQNPLPIELMKFSALPLEKKVDITWMTSSEINNDYFTVERSTDANSWEDLVTVDGAGNSSSMQEYETADERPYPGTSYYRLRQTDYDGKFSFSGIVAVLFTSEDQVHVSPNPVEGFLFIQCSKTAIDRLDFFDATGRLCLSINKPGGSDRIDVSLLHPGIYYLKTSDLSQSSMTKIVKQ